MIVYAGFDVQIHNLNMTHDEVLTFQKKIKDFVIENHPSYDMDSDVEVDLIETAGE
jgi:hypothetical protein